MKTKEEFGNLLQSLTEFEIADLCDVMYEHMEKNQLGHLAEKFNPDHADELYELERQVNSLEREMEEDQEELVEYKISVKKIISEYAPLKTAIEDFENAVSKLTEI